MLSRIHRSLVSTSRKGLHRSLHSQIQDPLLLPLAPPKPSLQTQPQITQHTFLDIPPAQDPLLHYIASSILRDGRRHTAERRVKYLLLHLHAFTRSPPLPILRAAIDRAAPFVRTVTHKKGGKSTTQPLPLSEKQRVHYAMKWILDASNFKAGVTVEERLAREILDVVKGESKALKKKDDIHTAAMVNRGNIRVPQQ